jgi:uncharacterized protein
VRSNLQFVIPFKGLKVGQHEFVSDVDDAFFESFEGSEVTKGDVHVEIILIKRENLLEFDFSLTGNVNIICDRCLDEFSLPIEYETKLFVKFGENFEEQTDEIIILSFAEHEIDLSQYIYEFICLSLPYRRVHPDDENGNSTCNKEMISKLNQYIVNESDQDTDPRWDNLKDFLLNN